MCRPSKANIHKAAPNIKSVNAGCECHLIMQLKLCTVQKERERVKKHEKIPIDRPKRGHSLNAFINERRTDG